MLGGPVGYCADQLDPSATAAVHHELRGHRVHQLVCIACQQPREPGHLGARAAVLLRLPEMIIENLGLPLLIEAGLRGQNRVVRFPPWWTL